MLIAGQCEVKLRNEQPDIELPGEVDSSRAGTVELDVVEATPSHPACLQVVVSAWVGELILRRIFRLYPELPALITDFAVKGSPRGSWGIDSRLDQLVLSRGRYRCQVLDGMASARCLDQFPANWVDPVEDRLQWLPGDLFILEAQTAPFWLALLKEKKTPDRLDGGGVADFSVQKQRIVVHDAGLDSSDVVRNSWRTGDTTVICLSDESLATVLDSLLHTRTMLEPAG